MIKIIIKKNGTTGWVELPLHKSKLNSIRPEQFLNENEMVSFALHEVKLIHPQLWRELKECTKESLFAENLNRNKVSLIRWINDSFGLLLHQNRHSNGVRVMRNMWGKIHKHITPLTPPEKTSEPTHVSFSRELELD